MDFRGYRHVVVCAKESGQGAYLASLLRTAPYRGRVYAYASAHPCFTGLPLTLELVDDDEKPDAGRILGEEKPEAVFLGAATGATLEKTLLVAARERGIPVLSFVDHYWNLWQRFAHERTAARWHYLPDAIFVIDEYVRERLAALGCPRERVHVLPHPTLEATEREHPKLSRADVRAALSIPAGAPMWLFISDYRFRDSARWDWDQPETEDYERLLTELLKGARENGGVVVVKLHPAQKRAWSSVLKRFPKTCYRVVRDFDRVSLLDASDAVFGLESMLLLHALRRRKKVYSLHTVQARRERWLSTLNPQIEELDSAAACRALLGRLAHEGRSV